MATIRRRTLLRALAAGAAISALGPLGNAIAGEEQRLRKTIPGTDESVNVIGMGTWRTFNVGGDPQLRDQRTEVLRAFLEQGGEVVDSSPMYGSAQEVLGHAIEQLDAGDRVFAADKVWTSDGNATRQQASESASKWGLERFDLMQVHNLLEWEAHLETLQAMKAEGEVRYIGITTSHGRRHEEFERVMANHDIDFVQLTYNMADREAEERLLPLAREKDIAVLVNRPYHGGDLIKSLQSRGQPLPDWAPEVGCSNWAEFLLKFTVSHPAVTCAIPATTKVAHMRENMGASRGVLPDARQRQRMVDYLESL
ncbi:MAG: aldo/keto reductase [Oleiphilaceae bacterium]|nr:aldo/keto reductase [Oleiphilaceae bacterium]